jgi:Protein kinase domain
MKSQQGTDELDGATMMAQGIAKEVPSEERNETGAFKTDLSRYTLGEKLGSGGMAAVFRAVDQSTGQTVALKLIDDGDDDPHRRTRFEREVRSAGRLIHPNICRVLSFGKSPGKLFMAMELVEGVTLQKVVKLRGTVPVPIALEALRQLLSALEVANRAGVVHRDLKPANVMVTPDGTLKLLDFGIAKSQEDATVTATGLLIGTPAFMSPEQILGGVVDGRSDLFSSGITFLVMLTGRARFQGFDPAAVMVKVTTEPVPSLLEEVPTASNAVDRFLARLCAQSLDARFANATEALAALNQLPDLPPDGPAQLARYIAEPDAVCAELAKRGATAELAKADALAKRGVPALPAQAIALYRASLLDPAESTRRRLTEVCQAGGLTFDPVDDPKIAEAYAAFEKTPSAPGVLKRLADLYRARGHVVYAAAFLTRYLRLKPTDSHAMQQLTVLLDGPEGQTGTNDRLRTRDIVAGIKTGGHVDPALARPGFGNVNAPGPLTAAGLRPRVEGFGAPVAPIATGQTGAQRLDVQQRTGERRAPSPGTGNTMAPSPVIIHTAAAPARASINVSPLLLVVGAVVVAGLVLAFFSRFIKTTVDDVQLSVSETIDQTGKVEANNIERLRKGYIMEARAQLDSGSPQAAIRQATLLIATDPPAELALEAMYLRAKGRLQMKDWRSARGDLEEYLAKSSLSDPRREDVKKLLADIHRQVAGDAPPPAPDAAPAIPAGAMESGGAPPL